MAENGGGHVDRVEQEHEQFRQELQMLLRAQVVFQDTLEKFGAQMEEMKRRFDQLSDRVDRLVAHDELQDRQIEALNGRVDALVSAIGEWIRHSNK